MLTYKRTKYHDLDRIYSREEILTIWAHTDKPIYRIGHWFCYGNRSSAKLLAQEFGEPLRIMTSNVCVGSLNWEEFTNVLDIK